MPPPGEPGAEVPLLSDPTTSRGARRKSARREPNAVDRALDWLVAEQNPDGSWGTGGAPGHTGLVILAFLGSGETHSSGQYKDVVKNGLTYLEQVQREDGRFGPCSTTTEIYESTWAALAMCEAYGLTGSRLFKEPAQRGVDFVLAARNRGLGWGDQIRDGVSNTTMTVWSLMVVKSASMSELAVDRTAFRDALAWLDVVTDPDTGIVWDACVGDGGTERPFPALHGDALAAAAVYARILCGVDPRKNALIRKMSDRILDHVRDGSQGDTRLIYFGTLAFLQVGGRDWATWAELLRTSVVPSQRSPPGSEAGSWAPTGTESPAEATVLRALCLEAAYYVYKRVFPEDR